MEEKKKNELIKWILISLAVLSSLLFVWLAVGIIQVFIWGCVIPDDIQAYNDIFVLARAINIQYNETGTIVENLYELPDKCESHVIDPWKRKIIYKREADGYIFLVTFGADGKKGGKGKKADIILYYNPADEKSFRMGSSAIPKTVNTRSKLRYLKKLILEYYRTYDKIPETLNDLNLEHEFFTNDDKDYWRNRIKYKMIEGRLVLVSGGEDLRKMVHLEPAIKEVFILPKNPELPEDIPNLRWTVEE